MRNYLTERIMKKEYYEGAGECPECMDKLPVNTEKEREEKKKILRHLLAKAAQGNYDEENYRISFRRKNTADIWKKTEVSVTCPVARKVYWRPLPGLPALRKGTTGERDFPGRAGNVRKPS